MKVASFGRGLPLPPGTRPMLVVTSNWCVPDGSLAAGPPPAFVDSFRAEVRRASLRAGVRADGSYSPVSGIAIVFAGDTFDWLTSREWTGDVRPWETTRRAAAARERVVARSLRLAGRLVATLAAWGRRGLDVPLADQRGRPRHGSSLRVPVSISLLRGDRDRWIDRRAAVGSGVSSVAVGSTWTDGCVTVRHGEEIEFPWHAGGSEPSLGESLSVELLARFGTLVADDAGLQPRVAAVLRRVVTGRLIDAPTRIAAWLAAPERRETLSPAERSTIVDGWNRAVCDWHRAAQRLGLGRYGGIDMLAGVATAMTLSADVGVMREEARVHRTVDDAGPRPVRRTACEILGHPPTGFSPPPAWGSDVLCIGPAALSIVGAGRLDGDRRRVSWHDVFDPPGTVPRLADADTTPAPATAIVAKGPAGPWLDWLPIGGAVSSAHGRPDDPGRHGIWRSVPSPAGGRIIDAA